MIEPKTDGAERVSAQDSEVVTKQHGYDPVAKMYY